MNPVEAAQLCATLRAATAIPTHYAFNGGVTDLVMLKYYAKQDELPDLFRDALKRYAPGTRPVVLQPGGTFTLDASAQSGSSANAG